MYHKKIVLFFIILFTFIGVKAQTPVVISQPYIFKKYVSVNDSLILLHLINSPGIGHLSVNAHGKVFLDTSTNGGKIYFNIKDFTYQDTTVSLANDTIGTGNFFVFDATTGFGRIDTNIFLPRYLHSNFTVHPGIYKLNFDSLNVITSSDTIKLKKDILTISNGTNRTTISGDRFKMATNTKDALFRLSVSNTLDTLSGVPIQISNKLILPNLVAGSGGDSTLVVHNDTIRKIATTSSSYTFGNGITNSGGNVGLGGTFTATTTENVTSFPLIIHGGTLDNVFFRSTSLTAKYQQSGTSGSYFFLNQNGTGFMGAIDTVNNYNAGLSITGSTDNKIIAIESQNSGGIKSVTVDLNKPGITIVDQHDHIGARADSLTVNPLIASRYQWAYMFRKETDSLYAPISSSIPPLSLNYFSVTDSVRWADTILFEHDQTLAGNGYNLLLDIDTIKIKDYENIVLDGNRPENAWNWFMPDSSYMQWPMRRGNGESVAILGTQFGFYLSQDDYNDNGWGNRFKYDTSGFYHYYNDYNEHTTGFSMGQYSIKPNSLEIQLRGDSLMRYDSPDYEPALRADGLAIPDMDIVRQLIDSLATVISGSGYVPGTRTLTINGVPHDLTTDQSWTVGTLSASNFVDSETPSGTINGSNVTFTLANTPTTGSVHLYLNGIRTTSFTISGGTITMTTAPSGTDTLLSDYRK